MAARGTFSFVLHSHIPYVLAHGRSPHGTDWLSEAACEVYLPLLDVCGRLVGEGVSPKITLGLTPVLVEQLRDPSFQDELTHYLEGHVQTARDNQARFERDGAYHLAYLARWWHDWYESRLAEFRAMNRDIVGAFAALQDAGAHRDYHVVRDARLLGLVITRRQFTGAGQAGHRGV